MGPLDTIGFLLLGWVTYTFAAVDGKTKQNLYAANTRSTTYSNVSDAGEVPMQKLHGDTRVERQAKADAAVERVCRDNDIDLHSGGDSSVCRGAASPKDGIPCKRCRHLYTKGLLRCPHCHDQAAAELRAGDDGNVTTLDGLEKVSSAIPTTIVGASSFWALKLKERRAMVNSEEVGRLDLFITKTCHEGVADIRALLTFLGVATKDLGVDWTKHQAE